MSWELAAAVAQVVGAAAVVVSLVYLAGQIRSQTRESRLNATRELAQDFRNLVAEVARDDDMFLLFRRSITDAADLSEEERARIHMFFYNRIFGLHEQVHLHLKEKSIDPVFLGSVQSRFGELMQTEGFRVWWTRNQYIYTDEFQHYVEKIINLDKTPNLNTHRG